MTTFHDRWMYHPNPQSVSQRAAELLPELWRTDTSGTSVIEEHHGQEVLFCAEWHGEKKGVTAYVPRQSPIVATIDPPRRSRSGAVVLVVALAVVAGAVVLTRSLQ